MYRPRIIPILLLRDLGLVKSVKFKKYRYIGDPINAVKIFNDLKADELVFLDIKASREKRKIPINFVERVGHEANMPFAVGGGIKTISDIKEIINAGAEKVIINTESFLRPDFIKEASEEFGSSTIVVSIDVRRDFLKREKVFVLGGRKNTKISPLDYAQLMESKGAGEIILNSIDRDGTMKGYDINLIKNVAKKVNIPVVALGGAKNLNDFKLAFIEGYASALAAGSRFVYHGPRNAVLINYYKFDELKTILDSSSKCNSV